MCDLCTREKSGCRAQIKDCFLCSPQLEDGSTFRGFIRVTMNLTRPVSVVDAAKTTKNNKKSSFYINKVRCLKFSIEAWSYFVLFEWTFSEKSVFLFFLKSVLLAFSEKSVSWRFLKSLFFFFF